MTDDAAALRVQSDDIVYLSDVAPRWFADQQARRRPEEKKSWLSPYVQCLVEARHKANPPENAVTTPPPTPVAHSGQIRPIARPQAPRQSISDKIARLPPMDEVMATMALLVPAECLAYQGFPPFLTTGHLPKDECPVTQERKQEGRENNLFPGIEEAKGLSAAELKEHFPLIHKRTHKAWDNMHGRRRAYGAKVHQDVWKFPGFLSEFGPRPGDSYTLDRIDTDDPEYAPGKCRWADKTEQANNRSNTLMLVYGGETLPAAVWARKAEQKENTIRKRRNRHPKWADEQIIFGEGGKAAFDAERAAGIVVRPWDYHRDEARREEAERFYQEYKHPGESPLVFCLSILRDGMKPWEDFFWDYVDPCQEYDPELDEGGKMVLRLEPVRAWLESILPRKPARVAKPASSPYRDRSRYEDPNLRDEARAELDAERAYDCGHEDNDP